MSSRQTKTLQGIFKPLNPKKYKGDPNKIVYRSSWELRAMQKFDKDPRIAFWSSEELIVPYYNPVKERPARYFPDFVIGIDHGNGIITKCMIEVKPHAECHPPKPPKVKKAKSQQLFIERTLTYHQNQAKWNAAEDFCMKYGWKFIVMTEYELGIKKKPSVQPS